MRLCLVALNALPAIDPAFPGPIGGIETRSWLLAQGLARREGVEVRFVVRHVAPLPPSRPCGVEVIPLIDPLYPLWQAAAQSVERRAGFPWVRIRRWSPRLLWQLPRLALDRLIRGRVYDADVPDPQLVQLEADLYATFGVQTHSAVVIRSAHAAGRPAVLFLGSDGDLDPLFEPGGTGIDPYGTRAEVGRDILASADHIIAQTPAQQQRLAERFGRTSTLLRNPIDVAAWEAGLSQSAEPQYTTGLSRYLLWIGRAEELHKRPQLCLEVARQLPDADFLMILNPRDPDVTTRIRASAPANVHIVEHVPAPQMPALFARATALVSTSRLEGFPNVFLQAALSGVPIASLEVGEEFLTTSRSGLCLAGDLSQLGQVLGDLWSGSLPSTIQPDHARRYVLEHHDLDRQADLLLRELNKLSPQASPHNPGGTP